MKIYCLSCNQSTSYESSKPKFCSHCGQSYINSTIASAPVIQSKPVFSPIISNNQPSIGLLNRIVKNEEFEYPEDATTVPQLDKIECELTIPNLRPNRESGKEVFNSGSPSEAKEILGKKPVKPLKVNKSKQTQIQQEFKEQFKNQLSKKPRNERSSTEIGS